MSEVAKITRRDGDKDFERATGELHPFQLTGFTGLVLEVEDVHFHFDSAVLMPDFADCDQVVDEADRNRITGLAAIRAAYRHTNQNPKQKLIVTGHTDRSGAADYNLKLSQMRADNVLAILVGNREEWVKICDKKHKVEDYQQILKWVHVIWDWDCDPGKVNNVPDNKTKQATKVFQQNFNRGEPEMEEGFSASIKEDGIVGVETWGAFFDVYTRVIMYIMEVDEEGLEELHQSLAQRFLDDTKKSVGCGENHPITENRAENFRSKIDRRVEVLFFDPAEEPRLNCHPAAGKCVPEKCEIFDDDMFQFDPIPCEPIPPPVRTWALRILKHPEPLVVQSGTAAEPDLPPEKRKPLANTPFVLSGAQDGDISGTTDGDGLLRVRVRNNPAKMILKIAGLQITLDGGTLPKLSNPDELLRNFAVRHRLLNLGYGKAKFDEWDSNTFNDAVKRFKKEHGLSPVDENLDPAFLASLKKAYGS